MTQRSPISVFLLALVTLGLYLVYWQWVTATEMNEAGADVPHPIWSLVPIVQLWWLARWSGGVARTTDGAWSPVGAFVVSLLLPGIGAALIQAAFNRASGGPLVAAAA